jgi:hypothetical protein
MSATEAAGAEQEDRYETELGEFWVAIFEDVRDAERELKKEGSPHRRRAYVRATFSSVEGFIFSLKRMALMKPALFQPDELARLREDGSFETASGERIQLQPRFLRLEENLAFAFAAFVKTHGSAETLPKDEGWAAFLQAIKVRNRITHPKSAADLEVNDEDVGSVRVAAYWIATAVLFSVAKSMGNTAVVVVLAFLAGWGLHTLGVSSSKALPQLPETD